MKYKALPSVAAIAIAAVLCSCEGRTSGNMEPTGDTVEVVINQQEVVETEVAD